MFVVNANRWRYCQIQPRKFERKVETLQGFSEKSLLRNFRSEIAKNYDFTYLLHTISRLVLIDYTLTPSSDSMRKLFSTAKFKCKQCLITAFDYQNNI